MSGTLIGGTSGLIAALMKESSSSKGSIAVSSTLRMDSTPHPKEEALFSIMDKEEVTRQKFEMGVIQFRTIKMQKDPSDTLASITEWYKENYPNITQSEIDARVNKAIFEQIKLLEDSKMGKFSPTGNYVSMREKSNRPGKPRKKIQKSNINTFLADLNDLYKNPDTKRWSKMFVMVNGTPDTAYFVPIQTDVIYNTKEGIPLGFSYDSVVKAFRVVYIPTGDPMFSYIYDNPLDAVKARMVHMKMLNWALEPQDIAVMYQQWYGSPEKYDLVFSKLHKQMFGEAPPYYIKVVGIFDAEKYYPDWRDQRAARNTLLTSVGGLGGIQNNTAWNDASYNARLKGQEKNYMSLKKDYTSGYSSLADRGRTVKYKYPGDGNPFSSGHMNQVKSGRGNIFKKPKWLTILEKTI